MPAVNLHRAELTALERDTQIGQWAELTAAKVGQVDPPSAAMARWVVAPPACRPLIFGPNSAALASARCCRTAAERAPRCH
jgi:hypothetical protein